MTTSDQTLCDSTKKLVQKVGHKSSSLAGGHLESNFSALYAEGSLKYVDFLSSIILKAFEIYQKRINMLNDIIVNM